MKRFWSLAVCTLGISLVALGSRAVVSRAAFSQEPVGLSLFFHNGQMAPLTLLGEAPRYVQEIDIVATVTTVTDDGIHPLLQQSELASLNWSGVTMVEEDWRPGLDGTTFIRQRFYRGATWMEQPSQFLVFPTDGDGRTVGSLLIARAGKDDRWGPADNGFVRRFVARQIATGCPAVGDCAGATFSAQGLVQFRNALDAEKRARFIPPQATRLVLKWTGDPHTPRSVEVTHAEASAFPFGYGFQVSLEPASTPQNGAYYVPGEQVAFRVTFRDGQGNRLHPPGALPSFGEFVRGEVASGLRYQDFNLFPTLYYALKHRESNMLRSLAGPTDRLRTPTTPAPLEQFLLPQVTVATAAVDGFSAVAQVVPEGSILLGGFVDPAVWDTPLSDVVTFTVPPDALPGTYVAALKARREFGGEALNRAATADVQVGTATPSLFTAQTGNCQTCHTGPAAFRHILHGVSDRRACFGCHGPLAIEPDTALDIRVHTVHDRSDRFRSVGNIRHCATCHLTPPQGPARGLLSHSGGGAD